MGGDGRCESLWIVPVFGCSCGAVSESGVAGLDVGEGDGAEVDEAVVGVVAAEQDGSVRYYYATLAYVPAASVVAGSAAVCSCQGFRL